MGPKNDKVVNAYQKDLLLRYAYKLLKSELDGIYEEIDKLCKKAPREPASDLQTKVVNRLIKRNKRFLVGDSMIDEMSSFIPAGDNPEYRDVLTVLRQLRQGLSRFHEKNSRLFLISVILLRSCRMTLIRNQVTLGITDGYSMELMIHMVPPHFGQMHGSTP
jgi:hypothetical protein